MTTEPTDNELNLGLTSSTDFKRLSRVKYFLFQILSSSSSAIFNSYKTNYPNLLTRKNRAGNTQVRDVFVGKLIFILVAEYIRKEDTSATSRVSFYEVYPFGKIANLISTMTTSAQMILHRLRTSRLPSLPTAKQVVSSTGAFKPFPERMSLGLLKVIALSIPTTIIGAELGRLSASFLEDWNIFVPDEDDD